MIKWSPTFCSLRRKKKLSSIYKKEKKILGELENDGTN